jgi:hypothetical protein
MRALAILVFIAHSWVPARATTLQKLTLGEMVEKSTSIVRAKVTASRTTLRGSDVYTVYRFETFEALKGQNGSTPTEVAVPGGIAGGVRQVVAGAPVLLAAHEYVLFLWTSRSGLTQLMGMSQGLFAVERTTPGVILTTRAAAGEQMLDSAGHATRDEALSMPWAELKAKVTAITGAGSK